MNNSELEVHLWETQKLLDILLLKGDLIQNKLKLDHRNITRSLIEVEKLFHKEAIKKLDPDTLTELGIFHGDRREPNENIEIQGDKNESLRSD